MSPNPYPKDTMSLMRTNDKVTLYCVSETLKAVSTQPTSVTLEEFTKLYAAMRLIKEVLSAWNKHKEPTNV